MGCWCETDGVTQLPINYGDNVRVFVLLYNYSHISNNTPPYSGGTNYSTDHHILHGIFPSYSSLEHNFLFREE